MPKRSPTTFQQIPLEKMEHGLARPVATLNLEPSEITSRLGLRFETSKDDLDELEAAVVSTVSGRQFALVRHRHQPQPGTDVLVNEGSSDLEADLRGVLAALHFGASELRWVHPEIDTQSLTTEVFEQKKVKNPTLNDPKPSKEITTTFGVGDVVRVHLNVKQGGKKGVKVFSGIVIDRKGADADVSITVRSTSDSKGGEKVFSIPSPQITRIEVKTMGAKKANWLNYLRLGKGKASGTAKAKTAKNAA